MSAFVVDGKAVAKSVRDEVAEKVYEEYGLKAPDSAVYQADWYDGSDVVTQGTFADAQYPDPEIIKNEKER